MARLSSTKKSPNSRRMVGPAHSASLTHFALTPAPFNRHLFVLLARRSQETGDPLIDRLLGAEATVHRLLLRIPTRRECASIQPRARISRANSAPIGIRRAALANKSPEAAAIGEICSIRCQGPAAKARIDWASASKIRCVIDGGLLRRPVYVGAGLTLTRTPRTPMSANAALDRDPALEPRNHSWTWQSVRFWGCRARRNEGESRQLARHAARRLERLQAQACRPA